MSLHPGMMITPSLKLIRQIGEGGMGSVWEAEHLTLHSRVAVKCLSAAMMNNAEAKARFEREALAAAQIRSPHVVQVLDHGFTVDGVPFIALEMLEGIDLNTRLFRLKRLELDEMNHIFSQTCKALSKAHSQGVVHRDIKPDNIFLTDADGEPFVKILDFGIAKRREDVSMAVTSTGVMIGTPYYMSPEQVLNSRDVDFHADLWSLAVVAYHCLTGKRPFEGETIGALCIAIDKARFEPPSALRPELPATLDGFFERALARKPEDRFSSAREMEGEFLAAAAGVSSGSRMSLVELNAARHQSIPPAWEPDAIAAGASPQPMAASEPPAQPTLSGQTLSTTSRVRKTVVPALIAMGMVVAGVGGWLVATRGAADAPAGEALAAMSAPPSASASASAPETTSAMPINVDELPRAPRAEEKKRDDRPSGEKAGDKPGDKPGDKSGDKSGDKPGDKSGDKPGDRKGASGPRKVKDRGF